MKAIERLIIIIMIATSMIFISCSTTVDNEHNSSILPLDSEQASGGEQTETDGKTDDKVDVYDQLAEAFARLEARDNYQAQSNGETVASLLNYTQTIKSVTTKSGELWLTDYSSNSMFVNLTHRVYTCGDRVVYNDSTKSGESECTAEEYRRVFGVTPYDGSLGGYEINLQTNVAINKESIDDGINFIVEADGERASVAMKIQMKKFGGLNDYPVFKRLSFTIKCDGEKNITSYSTYAEYEIVKNMGLLGMQKMTCKMTLETMITDYEGVLIFPKN